MLKRSIAFLALMAAAAPAAAQTADPAAARAQARAMISKVWADVAFVPDAWEGGPLVRHRRTGLVCRFNGDPRNSVDVYEGEIFTRVGCTVAHGDATLYTYADPPFFGGVEQTHMTAQMRLASAYANLTPYEGAAAPAERPAPGMPATSVSRFTGERDGKRVYIRLTSMHMGRWGYMQRAVGPVEKAADIDRLAEASLAAQAKDDGYPLGS